MFSEQLRRILGEIEPSTRAHFRGVFAVDELTQTVCKPGSYVINLDKRNEPGSHWVAVYVDPNKPFNNEEEEEEEEEEKEVDESGASHETQLSAAAAATTTTTPSTAPHFRHAPHTAQTRHPRCDMLVEYFDSYGRAPPLPELNRFLGRFAAAAAPTVSATPGCVWYNGMSLQPVYTGSCGFYCLYFILHRAMGQTAADIVHRLSRIDSHFHVKAYVLARYRLAFH